MTTAGGVLFPGTDPGRALASVPGWAAVLRGLGGALGTMSAGGRATVARELADAGAGLLGLDLADVLVVAWRRHRTLRSAAQSTKDSSAVEVVQLATHRITSTHRPSVDMMVNGVRLATVHFELTIVLDVEALTGTVRRARLVTLDGGRCTVTAGLACAGQELVSRTAVIEPAASVRLGDGLELL